MNIATTTTPTAAYSPAAFDTFDPALPPWPLAGAITASNPTGARTQMIGGRVCFDNASYRISVGDDDTVHILNQLTGEQYLAWGPPQVWVDGGAAFDFFGTTTLELHDGTKVTITTVPWADDPLITVSDKVTITNQHYGVEVLGMASTLAGDLRFVETLTYGWLLDAVVADGNVVRENPAGAGFVGEFAQAAEPEQDPVWQAVDQAYIDATDLARLGDLAGTRGRAWLSLSSLLSITFIGAFRGIESFRMSDYANDPQRESRRRSEDAQAASLRLQLQRGGAEARWFLPAPDRAGSGRP